ncbi:unnamed protein product [Nippostrongylus brasiliensis]|uniref:SUEL-type lectin domain-containing protein n=1 Tax=Nippostrongylus brasiliensis TaxID=27835 RepID=A0A0N4XK59_NIPBR|nr:unnamed protein product [Nippostrongylus brasiliensis]
MFAKVNGFRLVKILVQVDHLRFCDAYVQCVAVATLEERICLGNAIWSPFWFPPLKDDHDCHFKLRNDYIIIERMEEELDYQLATCLKEKARPLDDCEQRKCGAPALKSAAKFTYGRCVRHAPTNCFQGLRARVERECGQKGLPIEQLSLGPPCFAKIEVAGQLDVAKTGYDGANAEVVVDAAPSNEHRDSAGLKK